MRAGLLTFITLLLTAGSVDEDASQLSQAINVLEKVQNVYESHHRMSYEINYQIKRLGDDDTTLIDGFCDLKRDTSDTIFNGSVWLKASNNFLAYYDLTSIFLIDDQKKLITAYQPHEGQDWAIKSNTSSSLYNVAFLDSKKFVYDARDSLNGVSFYADSISGYYLIQIDYPDSPPFINHRKLVYVRKADFLIDHIEAWGEYYKEVQYQKWDLFNIEFDKPNYESYDSRVLELAESYAFKQYVPPKEDHHKLLENGTLAPVFSGKLFDENKDVSLTNYRGKLVLLDFSFMGCFWCHKSIPFLNSMQERFRNDVVVISINSKDNNEKMLKKMPDFIKNHNVQFSTLLCDEVVDSVYNVTGYYPTFYLIDRKGKIVHSQRGYSEKLDSTFIEQIKSRL